MTARIHWARIAWTLAAVGSFGAAEAQVSVRTTVERNVPPPNWKVSPPPYTPEVLRVPETLKVPPPR